MRTNRVTLAYHILLLLVGESLAAIGFLPALAAAAFWLPMCKVVVGIVTRPARLSLPRLGVIELGITLTFALVLVAAYG
ncbi:MAG TPA: hypothetical protein VF478_08720 [Anaerolineae bacterium]